MKLTSFYKSYCIDYNSLSGNTIVRWGDEYLIEFVRLGQAEGHRRAKEWIDNEESEYAKYIIDALFRFIEYTKAESMDGAGI